MTGHSAHAVLVCTCGLGIILSYFLLHKLLLLFLTTPFFHVVDPQIITGANSDAQAGSTNENSAKMLMH